jgi:hypothetical protein
VGISGGRNVGVGATGWKGVGVGVAPGGTPTSVALGEGTTLTGTGAMSPGIKQAWVNNGKMMRIKISLLNFIH